MQVTDLGSDSRMYISQNATGKGNSRKCHIGKLQRVFGTQYKLETLSVK